MGKDPLFWPSWRVCGGTRVPVAWSREVHVAWGLPQPFLELSVMVALGA